MFQQHGVHVVAPRGKKCWWLDRLSRDFDPVQTPMQHVRTDVVEWISRTWGVAPPGIGLLGISMGGQGALNIAYRHPQTFPVVAAISSPIDFYKAYGQGFPLDEMFESAEAARQESVVLHLHPLNWPKFQFFACDPLDPTWFAGNEILASKLASTGIPYECDLKTSLGGHTWEYFTRMTDKSLAFITHAFDQLQR